MEPHSGGENIGPRAGGGGGSDCCMQRQVLCTMYCSLPASHRSVDEPGRNGLQARWVSDTCVEVGVFGRVCVWGGGGGQGVKVCAWRPAWRSGSVWQPEPVKSVSATPHAP